MIETTPIILMQNEIVGFGPTVITFRKIDGARELQEDYLESWQTVAIFLLSLFQFRLFSPNAFDILDKDNPTSPQLPHP